MNAYDEWIKKNPHMLRSIGEPIRRKFSARFTPEERLAIRSFYNRHHVSSFQIADALGFNRFNMSRNLSDHRNGHWDEGKILQSQIETDEFNQKYRLEHIDLMLTERLSLTHVSLVNEQVNPKADKRRGVHHYSSEHGSRQFYVDFLVLGEDTNCSNNRTHVGSDTLIDELFGVRPDILPVTTSGWHVRATNDLFWRLPENYNHLTSAKAYDWAISSYMTYQV